MRRSRLSQKLAALERTQARGSVAGWKPWIYCGSACPVVTLPDGTTLPGEVVDEAWRAAHPEFRYIEVDDDPADAAPAPESPAPGEWYR